MSLFTEWKKKFATPMFPLEDAHDINYERIRVCVQQRRLEEFQQSEETHKAQHAGLMMRCHQRDILRMTVADYLRRRILENASLNASLLSLDDEAGGK